MSLKWQTEIIIFSEVVVGNSDIKNCFVAFVIICGIYCNSSIYFMQQKTTSFYLLAVKLG